MRYPRLIVLTDRTQVPSGRRLIDIFNDMAQAGLETVVLREIDLPDDERAGMADDARSVGLDVVAAHRPMRGCTALHLPAPAEATVAQPQMRWGRSCHSRDDLMRAVSDGAWWATLSPFAATPSKPGYGPPLDASVFEQTPLPVFALGGVTVDNAAAALAAGAYGVAVMGEVMRSREPGAVVAELLRVVGS